MRPILMIVLLAHVLVGCGALAPRPPQVAAEPAPGPTGVAIRSALGPAMLLAADDLAARARSDWRPAADAGATSVTAPATATIRVTAQATLTTTSAAAATMARAPAPAATATLRANTTAAATVKTAMKADAPAVQIVKASAPTAQIGRTGATAAASPMLSSTAQPQRAPASLASPLAMPAPTPRYAEALARVVARHAALDPDNRWFRLDLATWVAERRDEYRQSGLKPELALLRAIGNLEQE